MYCDLWPYVLWPLDFQIQKRIVSAEAIWGNAVVNGNWETVDEKKNVCKTARRAHSQKNIDCLISM